MTDSLAVGFHIPYSKGMQGGVGVREDRTQHKRPMVLPFTEKNISSLCCRNI